MVVRHVCRSVRRLQQCPDRLARSRDVDDGVVPQIREWWVRRQTADDPAYVACSLSTPAVTALVDCLRDAGLDIVVDGRTKAGPWSDALRVPWEMSRDDFAVTEFGGPQSVASLMPHLECFVERGWLMTLARPFPSGDAAYLEAQVACPVDGRP